MPRPSMSPKQKRAEKRRRQEASKIVMMSNTGDLSSAVQNRIIASGKDGAIIVTK